MKFIITLLFIVTVNMALAQLTITPNASLYFAGISSVTLEDMSFVNNGSFFPDSSVATFAGTGNNSISFNSSVEAPGFPTSYSDMRLMAAQIESYGDNQVRIAGLKIVTTSYNGGANTYNFVLENESNVAGTLHVRIYFAIIGRE